MKATFRASMNELHTWAGVVFGALLFAIFWMGTLSVFDHEINRWMIPSTRLAPAEKLPSLDSYLSFFAEKGARSPSWTIVLPSERQPATILIANDGGRNVRQSMDPATGEPLPEAYSLAGTGFIFPFHYNLNLAFAQIGYWIVGAAGMAMMIMCISGVVIHRKMFADFFTFRLRVPASRSLLDLHNVAGVIGFPFHFLIALSGLIILFTLYFPAGWAVLYQNDPRAFTRDLADRYARPRLNQPADRLPLDQLAAQASARWQGAPPSMVRIWHPGDAASYVEIHRSIADGITTRTQVAYFDGRSGELIHESRSGPALSVQRFIAGLHFIQFSHWTLRWIYFSLGLVGCTLIATGYLFWLESRRKKSVQGQGGTRFVDGLTIGSVSGIMIATLAFLIANRLLPVDAAAFGIGRSGLEVLAFYLVWLVAYAHAWVRRGLSAWTEQCWAIAFGGFLAVALNAITTGDHLGRTLINRHLWPVGGMDAVLIATSCAAAYLAHRLSHRRVSSTAASEASRV